MNQDQGWERIMKDIPNKQNVPLGIYFILFWVSIIGFSDYRMSFIDSGYPIPEFFDFRILRYIPTPPKKKSQRNPSQTTWYYLRQSYEISLRYPKTS
jgi:hypothetical protein